MAFIKTNTSVISFADYQDVVDTDQRLFDANEGLTDLIIENLLIKSTERILTSMRSTTWWQNYYIKQSSSAVNTADVPKINPVLIKDRFNDFTDLCVAIALSEYILPKIADFGDKDNAEVAKMSFYKTRSQNIFDELIRAGDWYDFNATGVITSAEKMPGIVNKKRIR